MKDILLFGFLTLTVVLIGTKTDAYGQGYSGVGYGFSGGFGGGSAEGSRFPFRVKLSGTLNPTAPSEDSIKVATLAINGYQETYRLAITHVESVDDKQLPRVAIIPSIVGLNYDYLLMGSNDLLSKIGQSLPNTPITITGFLRQRKSELILESVETLGLHNVPPIESVESESLSPDLPSAAIEQEHND